MIGTVTGALADRTGDAVLMQTDAGVGYEITVPLGVLERLPENGARCTLFTELVVREDEWTLYGFDTPGERHVFRRLLTAGGFGPRLALALLSTLGPDRTVRSIQGRDIAALSTVSGIGKKKAERLILELHDRFKDVVTGGAAPRPAGASEDAVRALEALGYGPAEAGDAVRQSLDPGAEPDVPALIRRALHLLTTKGRNR